MITDYSELSEDTPLSKRIREIREIRNHTKHPCAAVESIEY